MAGVKRRSKYRKNVTETFLHGEAEPEEGQKIVRVMAPRGGNIIEVVEPDGTQGLCIIPTKFRKLIWVKRGDFVIAACVSEEDLRRSTASVRYMVVHVLNRDHIRHLRSRGLWPSEFGDSAAAEEGSPVDGPEHAEGGGGGGAEAAASSKQAEDEEDDEAGAADTLRRRIQEAERRPKGALPSTAGVHGRFVDRSSDVPLEDDPFFARGRANRRAPVQIDDEDDEEEEDEEDEEEDGEEEEVENEGEVGGAGEGDEYEEDVGEDEVA